MSQPEAEAAWLRLAFHEAAEAFGDGRHQPLEQFQRTWGGYRRPDGTEVPGLYQRIRDSGAGLAMLAELEIRQQRVDALEAEVARLSGLVPRPPKLEVKADA